VVDHYRMTVPENARNKPLTLSITVRSDRVGQVGASPDDLVIKAWDGGAWRAAETTVQRTDDGVELSARLSALPRLLAVATPGEAPQQPPGTTTPAPDGPTPTPPSGEVTPPPTDGPADVPSPTPAVESPGPPGQDDGLVDVLLPVLLVLVVATGLAVAWVLATQNVARFYEKWR
jgi:hypothetical protein